MAAAGYGDDDEWMGKSMHRPKLTPDKKFILMELFDFDCSVKGYFFFFGI